MHDRYRVITGPPLSPPTVSAEDFEGLAAALNALDHPVGAALNELTVDMVELAFNSLPPRERQKLLGGLGIRMAAPRRAGRALCQDLLSRMRRDARQHTCSCGIRDLTPTVLDQIIEVAFAQDCKTVSEPVSRWGTTLLRATVFAWCNASVADAYLLAWAADQDWFMETADEEETVRLAAVVDEARSVMSAYPDFDGRREGVERLSAGAGAGAGTRPGRTAVASKGAASNSGAPHDVPVIASEEAGAEQRTDPEEACRQLESALAGARRAAENVTGAVADGLPPHHGDLAVLDALGAVFDSADAAFRAAGVNGVPRSLKDMTQAAREYRTARDHDDQVRGTLRDLLDVAGQLDGPAAVAAEAVRGATRRLLDAEVWELTQRQESAVLADLARLIRVGREAYAATEILALQDQMVRVLPACAMAVIMAPELVLAQPQETFAQSPEVEATEGDVGGVEELAADDTTAEHGEQVSEQEDEWLSERPDGRATGAPGLTPYRNRKPLPRRLRQVRSRSSTCRPRQPRGSPPRNRKRN